MNKTLTISSSLLLSLVLGAIVPIGSTVYWVSNLATRVQHTEAAVGNFKETDTSKLQERLVTVEERVQFNNDSIKEVYVGMDKLIPRVKRSDVIFHAKRGLKEVYVGMDKLDTEMKDMEDKLAGWMETEMAKIYDILNNKGNPLGQ